MAVCIGAMYYLTRWQRYRERQNSPRALSCATLTGSSWRTSILRTSRDEDQPRSTRDEARRTAASVARDNAKRQIMRVTATGLKTLI
jgi:hypothetical protein